MNAATAEFQQKLDWWCDDLTARLNAGEAPSFMDLRFWRELVNRYRAIGVDLLSLPAEATIAPVIDIVTRREVS